MTDALAHELLAGAAVDSKVGRRLIRPSAKRKARSPKCVTRMKTRWPATMATATAESTALQPGPPASSLHASWLAVVPGQPVCTESTVSGPDPGPAKSRVPHVVTWNVPLQRATNVYQMSRLLLEAPQLALPSGPALRRSA